MLDKRFEKDTASLSNRIDLKVNIADTSDMLSRRIARDTVSLSNRINLLKDASGGALADSIDNIRLKIKSDSTTIRRSLVDSSSALNGRINLKLNIADTANMLTNRFARDTVSLSNRINRLAGATDGALADSISLIRAKMKSDSSLIGLALIDSSNYLNGRINLKLNIADTADMLTNRIKKDTSYLVQKRDTAAWLNSRFARDTVSLSNRITNLLGASFAEGIVAGYLKVVDAESDFVQFTDTASMLSNRFARDTASLSNRINRLAGATDGALSDSVITIRNKIVLDSTVLATKIRADSTKIRTSLVDSSSALNGRINLKLNIADTALMLTNRFARDTVSLSSRIDLLKSATGGALGDSIAGIRAKIILDSTVII